jgi:hypothetical protein
MTVIIEFHPLRVGLLDTLNCAPTFSLNMRKHAHAMFFKGQEVILVPNKCSINHFDGGWGRPLRIYRHRSRVIWDGKCHPLQKILGCWIHCKARTSVDSTLGVKELQECFDDVFSEGSDVSKIRARLQ